MLQTHYDIKYKDFHPTSESMDSSHTIAGFGNPYNHEPMPVPDSNVIACLSDKGCNSVDICCGLTEKSDGSPVSNGDKICVPDTEYDKDGTVPNGIASAFAGDKYSCKTLAPIKPVHPATDSEY